MAEGSDDDGESVEGEGGGGGAGASGEGEVTYSGALLERTNAVCGRLAEVAVTLSPLLKARLDPGRYLEVILVVCRRAYDVLGKVLKLLLDHRARSLPRPVRDLLKAFSETFTPAVHDFIAHTMSNGQADKAQLLRQVGGKFIYKLLLA